MSSASDYTPPKVWVWNTSGPTGVGRFANMNRPTAGARHDKELPVGKHPLHLRGEPAMVDKLKSLYFEPAGESLGQYASFISSEIVRWRKIVQAAGVKVD